MRLIFRLLATTGMASWPNSSSICWSRSRPPGGFFTFTRFLRHLVSALPLEGRLGPGTASPIGRDRASIAHRSATVGRCCLRNRDWPHTRLFARPDVGDRPAPPPLCQHSSTKYNRREGSHAAHTDQPNPARSSAGRCHDPTQPALGRRDQRRSHCRRDASGPQCAQRQMTSGSRFPSGVSAATGTAVRPSLQRAQIPVRAGVVRRRRRRRGSRGRCRSDSRPSSRRAPARSAEHVPTCC